MVRAFLDHLRTAVIIKVEGAPEPQVRTSAVASGTTLLGLARHLAHVERALFCGLEVRSWPATLRARASDTVASVLADYQAAIAEANAVIDTYADWESTLSTPGGEPGPTVRWAMVHMIEETGRHAGHADILRELIDGSTGR